MDYNQEKIKKIEDGINELENKIKERKSNLPAHSIKPYMIQEIEDLEEELDNRIEELRKIK